MRLINIAETSVIDTARSIAPPPRPPKPNLKEQAKEYLRIQAFRYPELYPDEEKKNLRVFL